MPYALYMGGRGKRSLRPVHECNYFFKVLNELYVRYFVSDVDLLKATQDMI